MRAGFIMQDFGESFFVGMETNFVDPLVDNCSRNHNQSGFDATVYVGWEWRIGDHAGNCLDSLSKAHGVSEKTSMGRFRTEFALNHPLRADELMMIERRFHAFDKP